MSEFEMFLYMTGIVLVGFAVNYGLRALPFLLFSGRDRQLPKWVEPISKVLSPVIIGGLIIYSFATLKIGPERTSALKTAWPYLAGFVTVALHLWRKNPLASIVAGTVVYMCLLNCGCVTTVNDIKYDIDHPLIKVSGSCVKFLDKPVFPEEIPGLLEKYRIPKDATIYILVDENYTDQRALWVLRHNYITRAGYPRSAWIYPRQSVSGSAEELSDKLEERKIEYTGKRLKSTSGGLK